MIPSAVVDWLEQNRFGKIISRQPVSGGCINHGMVVQTRSGDSFFVKVNLAAPKDMFECEAKGLETLSIEGGPIVPKPLLQGNDFLLMENLSPVSRKPDYWVSFGRALAILHDHQYNQFGFDEDNYIGSTPQPNPWMEDGYDFFAQERLLYMANLASRRGLLDPPTREKITRLVSRLRSLVPEQPPSLLHGDLWCGNAMTDWQGNPAIIDPAVHYGWAEAELAMTTLFGSFPTQFYQAYEEVRPLEPGYQERFPIYNLYHLLNHVVLFGRGYLSQVQSTLDRVP